MTLFAPDLCAQQTHWSATPGVSSALSLARELGASAPLPGRGHTLQLWQLLAELGAFNLTTARVIEPHLDARAILAEADEAPAGLEDATFGVFAAEGPGVRLRASHDDGAWQLSGRKPWCSLSSRLDAALVTAWVSDTERRLFAVDLRQRAVQPVPGQWVAHGLPDVTSGPVDFSYASATPVGENGWYLDRPGFAWGGIGVAAVWFGGAVAVANKLTPDPNGRPLDQIGLAHIGACDVALAAARATLQQAAGQVDDGGVVGDAAARLATRVRSVVAQAAETVLQATAHASGPAPLALDADHTARVSDLQLYVRQWHAERDLASLGKSLTS